MWRAHRCAASISSDRPTGSSFLNRGPEVRACSSKAQLPEGFFGNDPTWADKRVLDGGKRPCDLRWSDPN
eukprot:533911-Alexandrium_andersonii.AAC.1